MGLDMYIYKNKTVEYDQERREKTVKISEVLYLRKANQIHRYIVENLAGGVDECQEICMDIEDIKTLNDICKRIVKESRVEGDIITNPELAQGLLPTQAGFFFGDTDYDEHYIDDLKEYIRQADEIIADYENEIANGTVEYDLDYTYQASW